MTTDEPTPDVPVERSDEEFPAATQRRRLFQGRRRANDSAGPRSHRTVIAHSDGEWVRVKAMAAAQGVSVPRLYARALWTGDAVAAERMSAIYAEVFGARRGIALGLSNINQIAKVANSTGEIHMDQLVTAMAYLERQYEHLNGVLAQLPGGESPTVARYENPRYLIERDR